MRSLLRKRGFTLIEILIVVVIIGILAALILPRMLAQPERAITAEALQYMGVIRRAIQANAQPGLAFQSITSGDPAGSPTQPNTAWTSLGLDQLPQSTSFTYECTYTPDDPDTAGTNEESGTCTATRLGTGPRADGTIQMDVFTGFISACGGTGTTAYKLSGTSNERGATCV